MKEGVPSVELGFPVWVIEQDPLVREVRVLSHFRDEYEGIAWKCVVDAEVEYFSAFRDRKEVESNVTGEGHKTLASLSEDLAA